MKKIFIFINSLDIGGSEKSLIAFLNSIDYKKYEIDLCMQKINNDLKDYVPENINSISVPNYYKYLKKSINISNIEKAKYFIGRIKTSYNLRINEFKRFLNKDIQKEQIIYFSQKNLLEYIDKEYDVAIAFAQGFPTYFIVDKVKAKQRVAWINCDYSNAKFNQEIDEVYYKKIDKVVVVSNSIKKSIEAKFPYMEDKINVILDIINPSVIEKMSFERTQVFPKSNKLIILTVARIVDSCKGYLVAIDAAKRLKELGYNFVWYCIGDGEDKELINNKIEFYNLNEDFILLGKKENPYPFMRECDVYVQPSRKEGFGLTVVEAKILRKPIICTNFNTAKEIIRNEYDGIIVDVDYKALANGIINYIENRELKDKIKNNLEIDPQYNTTNEINKFYKIVEG